MDVILHLGAHRTGTASFQSYMRRHSDALAAQGVHFLGARIAISRRPEISKPCAIKEERRDFVGLGEAWMRYRMDKARRQGAKTLVISDEDIIGNLADNVRHGTFYRNAGSRLAQLAGVFEGQALTVLFSPRKLDTYWCSALSTGVSNGQKIPAPEKLAAIARSRRGWRDVIGEIATVLPHASLQVLPFEHFAGRPEVFLEKGAQVDAPLDTDRKWLNRAPTLPHLRRAITNTGGAPSALPFGMGRWNPFSNEELAALRETYADDMMWLVSGADGLATLTEDCPDERATTKPPSMGLQKGRSDELKERHVARPG